MQGAFTKFYPPLTLHLQRSGNFDCHRAHPLLQPFLLSEKHACLGTQAGGKTQRWKRAHAAFGGCFVPFDGRFSELGGRDHGPVLDFPASSGR